MVARPWSSACLTCAECRLLRCDGKAGNSFTSTQEMDPSSRARRQKGAPLDVGGTLVLPARVEMGMSGNFLSCSKGVKDPLEVPEFRCD